MKGATPNALLPSSIMGVFRGRGWFEYHGVG
jgi:hypothetical protein